MTLNFVLDGKAYACELVHDPTRDAWAFPVGEAGYPVEKWYVAQGYSKWGHNGIDINLAMYEFGDVERRLGLSVYSLTYGIVEHVIPDWYGNPAVVIRHQHDGEPLWVRYAHIVPTVKVNDVVKAKTTLGAFADWRTGDHLHLDVSTTPYLDNGARWQPVGRLDPIPVLKAHLDANRVDAMVAK